MIPFLQKIAHQLIENHKNNFENVCIILPNHRSILFLKKYLSELLDQPVFAPKMWSIDDFVFETTHLQRCERVDLLFELFEIHRLISKESDSNFDNFIQWGAMILNDFEEIDANLVDADKIFSHLTDIKAIESWNIDKPDPTTRENDYVNFYSSLSTYYKYLREKVLLNNSAWSKLAYRIFCEKFSDFFHAYSNKSFYIIGFNALTTSEETLFNLIRRNAKTEILWDFDNYYLQKQQEAGFFLRKNFNTFGQPDHSEDHQFFKQKKEIHLHNISKNIGQTLETTRILQNSDFNPDETAIVLNDETLLMPLLNFLPETFTKFNVTMGYPLKSTQLYECIESWLTLHTTASKNDNKFYYKELFKFVQHPIMLKYIRYINLDAPQIIAQNILEYKKCSIPFLSCEDIKSKIFHQFPDIYSSIEKLFVIWNHSLKNALIGLTCFIENLRFVDEKEEDTIELEYLFQVMKTIHRLETITQQFSNLDTGMQSIKTIFRELFQAISIPFSGEPLGGLQIMGLLESRLLDFKNIVMLSVNEGFIPSNSIHKTFIPFDIRKHYGLPTLPEENAVVAYHFYRLLQRAEKVHFLYNCADSQGVGSNEKSRFITQLIFELPQYCPDISIINHTESLPTISSDFLPSLKIEKDESVMKRLYEIAKDKLSPSSINTYLDCSLKFYFSKILKIKEIEDLTENVDTALLGQIIHKVFENIHKPLINLVLTPDDIDKLLETYEKELKNCFETMWKGGNYATGRNRLLYYVSEQWIKSFLKHEKDLCQNTFFIKNQEFKMTYPLTIQVNGMDLSVNLSGIADRICSENDVIKIIDFKTGKVEANNLIIKNFEEFISSNYKDKPKPKALQLLMYSWLYYHKNNNMLDFEAAIISMQKPSQNFILNINDQTVIDNEIMENIEQLLRKIVEEIFNQEIPFEATKNDTACKYCDFTELCQWKKIKNSPIVANLSDEESNS